MVSPDQRLRTFKVGETRTPLRPCRRLTAQLWRPRTSSGRIPGIVRLVITARCGDLRAPDRAGAVSAGQQVLDIGLPFRESPRVSRCPQSFEATPEVPMIAQQATTCLAETDAECNGVTRDWHGLVRDGDANTAAHRTNQAPTENRRTSGNGGQCNKKKDKLAPGPKQPWRRFMSCSWHGARSFWTRACTFWITRVCRVTRHLVVLQKRGVL